MGKNIFFTRHSTSSSRLTEKVDQYSNSGNKKSLKSLTKLFLETALKHSEEKRAIKKREQLTASWRNPKILFRVIRAWRYYKIDRNLWSLVWMTVWVVIHQKGKKQQKFSKQPAPRTNARHMESSRPNAAINVRDAWGPRYTQTILVVLDRTSGS